LGAEAFLAYFAFSSLTNDCDPDHGHPKFPCAINGLYNKNFLDLPVVG
jgi:hypothetical protein